MLQIHYFANIRERLKREQEQLELPASVSTVAELIDYLQNIYPEFSSVLSDAGKVLIAVNQTVVSRDHPLSANDEVAFFPPMTGG